MKYYFIAGEASGDLHGSNLIVELQKLDSSAKFRCWGGDLMIAQNCDVVKHIRDLAFMGFTEVLANVRTIFKNISFCKEDILQYKPDALILVDYPGFNLRIAKWAKKNNIRTFYYISPTVWAWKEGRVENIRRDTEKLFCILPFEKPFYAKHNIHVDYEGHPLLDSFENNKETYGTRENFLLENNLDDKPIIAVLPGSRKQEIKHILPEMLKVFGNFKEYQFIIAGAPALDIAIYEQQIKNLKVKVLFGKTYQILNFAQAGIIASGTATLETALFGVPQVLCYKAGKLSWFIGRKIVKVNYVGLVNLILNKEVVKELLQDEMTKDKIIQELNLLLNDTERRKKIQEGYDATRKLLGGSGVSARIAKKLYGYILNKQ